MTDWTTVHDSAKKRPLAIDTTSSATTVYERRDIRLEEQSINIGDNARPVVEWVYDQREYTREEYAQMHSPATQSIMQAISDLELSVAMIGIE